MEYQVTPRDTALSCVTELMAILLQSPPEAQYALAVCRGGYFLDVFEEAVEGDVRRLFHFQHVLSNLDRTAGINFLRSKHGPKCHIGLKLASSDEVLSELIDSRGAGLSMLQSLGPDRAAEKASRSFRQLEHPARRRVSSRALFAAWRCVHNWLIMAIGLRYDDAASINEMADIYHGLRLEAEMLVRAFATEITIPSSVTKWLARITANLPEQVASAFLHEPITYSGGGHGAPRPKLNESESRYDPNRIYLYMEMPGWVRVASRPGVVPHRPEYKNEVLAHLFRLDGSEDVLAVFETAWTGHSAWFLKGPEEELLARARLGRAGLRDEVFWVREPVRHSNSDVSRCDWADPVRDIVAQLRQRFAG